jgi:hypothetical protein
MLSKILIVNLVFVVFVLLWKEPHRDFAVIYKCPPDMSQRCDFTISGQSVCGFNSAEMVGILSEYPVDIVCDTGVAFFDVYRQIVPVLKGENVFNCRIIPKTRYSFCLTIEPRNSAMHCYSSETGDKYGN